MITKDKITEIFCIADDFCKEFELETDKTGLSEKNKGCHRHRKWRMSKSEIITILICFHFNSYRNFRHYYTFFVKEHLADLFPNQLSYNRFLELEARVSVEMMMFLQICCFGRCTGISFIDSTCIPVCHNKRIYRNKVFKNYATRARVQWDGILDSNYILSVMKEVRFLTLCLLKQMLMTGTKMYLTD